MVFEPENFSIKKGLPTFFADNAFFDPINDYTQNFIPDSIKKLLSKLGVIQPWQVWKNIPEFYNWIRQFEENDERLFIINEGYIPGSEYENKLHFGIANNNDPIMVEASVPLTQRPCNAVLNIKLKPTVQTKKTIEYIQIENAGQKIIISNLNNYDEISYDTESNALRINGEFASDQLSGSIYKIYSTPIIDLNKSEANSLSIDNRNAENKILIHSSGEEIDFDLSIELKQPTYIIDQNIQLWSVSALPLTKVELYGYYCNTFNNNHGWKLLETKHYKESDRVTYDRFTTQYDVEIFFIKTYYAGLDNPVVTGFPQEENAPNPVFETNKTLDYWGSIYGLPRQNYRDDITEDEEPLTRPAKYYNYNKEQDYWYQQRLSNEYRINESNEDGIWLKDSDNQNIGIMKCIDPYIEDLHIYTESNQTSNGEITKQIKINDITETGNYKEWINIENLQSQQKDKKAQIIMNPDNSDSLENNMNKSNLLTFILDFTDVPDYVELTGFNIFMNLLSSLSGINIEFDERSGIRVPYLDSNNELYWKLIPLNYLPDLDAVEKDYDISDSNFEKTSTPINLMLLKKYGAELHLGFTNYHIALDGEIDIYNFKFNIQYKTSKRDVNIETYLNKNISRDIDDIINLHIKIHNVGEIPVIDGNIFIFSPNLTLSESIVPINLGINEYSEHDISVSSIDSGNFEILILAVGKESREQFIALR